MLVARVLVRREPGVPVAGHGLILLGEVNALAVLDVIAVALGESARALRQAGLDNRLGGDPVAECVLTVLDDRLAGVVAVVCLASLAGSHGRVIDQVQKVLSVSSDDGDLLAVLPKSVKLVLESGLDLLARDVGQLCLGHQGLGLSTDEFLLQHNDARRVRVLVLELGDLIGDLLLAYTRLLVLSQPCGMPKQYRQGFEARVGLTVTAGLYGSLNVPDALDGHAVLVIAIDEQVLQFTNLVDQDTKLIRDVRHILVAGLTPEGKLLLGIYVSCDGQIVCY